MVFAKRFCTAAAAIIFLFVLAIQALAGSIDGSVSPDEVRGTNVQIQCENENGGNGICALATYYTKTEKLALGCDKRRYLICRSDKRESGCL